MPTISRTAKRRGPLILILALATTAAVGAEESVVERFAGRPLPEALGEIQALGLRLIYSSDIVKPWMRVEVEPKSHDPRGILDELLAPHDLEAREGPGSVLFVVSRNGGRPATGGIGGVVRGLDDLHPIPAVPVRLDATLVSAITGPDGSFRITGLPPGDYDLIVAVPGLQEERFDAVPVEAGRQTSVTLDLTLLPNIREELVITPERDGSREPRPDSGRFIDAPALQNASRIGGDAQRAIAWQPGVASGDMSAQFNLRGGEPNETLVLFDGLELYDPFHLKSFQSFSGIIDAMVVGNAELFSEAFPVEYGDRMSGVLNLSTSVPEAPGSTLVSASVINSRVMTSGGFQDGSGHWLVSARAWYPDSVVRTIDREGEGFDPTYYDLLGKVEFRMGEKTILSTNFLSARDKVDFTDLVADETVDADSGTRYAWLNLKSLWSPRLFSRTLFSIGRVRADRDGVVLEDGVFSKSVDDDRGFDVIGFGQDWTARASEQFLLKFGLLAKWLDSEYRYRSLVVEEGAPTAPDGTPIPTEEKLFLEPSGRQAGAYVAGQLQPADAFMIELGLRWDHQSYTGERQVSPRVSLLQKVGDATRLRAGWGRYYQSQGIHQLQVEDGLTDFFPAQLAEHWTIGLEHEFANGYTFRTDAYLKEMSDLRPRFENLFNPFELLPEFEVDRVRLDPDRAEAKGIDFTLSMNRGGPFSWWASYSRSSIEDEFSGEKVPRSWDQPHAFRFGVQYRTTDRWDIGLAGTYHSGWPTTSIGGEVVTAPDGSMSLEPVLGPRNDIRYPAYHRLDLRIARHFRFDTSRLTLFAEVSNLYDRDNVCCVEDVLLTQGVGGNVDAEREFGLWMQRVPSVGIMWRFDH